MELEENLCVNAHHTNTLGKKSPERWQSELNRKWKIKCQIKAMNEAKAGEVREEDGGERGQQEELGDTITSLEHGQSQTGLGPNLNHRGCLVSFPSSVRQTNDWIHVGIKRLCSPQMEL